MIRAIVASIGALAIASMAVASPADAQYRKKIANDMTRCYAGSGPAVMVTVNGIQNTQGIVRVQSYRGTQADWLQKGRWINRIEVPTRAETMTFCMPVPGPGTYAIAVRHDANGNRKTDISLDGGGMSNNPSINIFNLGKPSYKKTAFEVGNDVKSIRIIMKYM